MKIYAEANNGTLEETTLYDLLQAAFRVAGFNMDSGGWEKENHHWVGVVQKSKKPEQITTNITFENDGNTITGLHIHLCPIKTIVDDENSMQII